VSVASRSVDRAQEVCDRIAGQVPEARLEAVASADSAAAVGGFRAAIQQADLIVAAGAAGVMLLDAAGRVSAVKARVLIDLNAVPPAGIEGIVAADKARADGAAVVYGALGVGGTKMKIHRAAIARLFESNDTVLDAEELLAIGERL
jgi:hypothetical protein